MSAPLVNQDTFPTANEQATPQVSDQVGDAERLFASIQSRSINAELQKTETLVAENSEMLDTLHMEFNLLKKQVESLNLDEVRSMMKDLMLAIESQTNQIRDMLEAASHTVYSANELLEATKVLVADNNAEIESSRVAMSAMKNESDILLQSFKTVAEEALRDMNLRRTEITEELRGFTLTLKDQATTKIRTEVSDMLDKVLANVRDVNDSLVQQVHEETERADASIAAAAQQSEQNLVAKAEEQLHTLEESASTTLHTLTTTTQDLIASVEKVEHDALEQVSEATDAATHLLETSVRQLSEEEKHAMQAMENKKEEDLQAIRDAAAQANQSISMETMSAQERISETEHASAGDLNSIKNEIVASVHETEQELETLKEQVTQESLVAQHALHEAAQSAEAELKSKEHSAMSALTSATNEMEASAQIAKNQLQEMEEKVLSEVVSARKESLNAIQTVAEQVTAEEQTLLGEIKETSAEITQHIQESKEELEEVQREATATVQRDMQQLQQVGEELAQEITDNVQDLKHTVEQEQATTERFHNIQVETAAQLDTLVTTAKTEVAQAVNTVSAEVSGLEENLRTLQHEESVEHMNLQKLAQQVGVVSDTADIHRVEHNQEAARQLISENAYLPTPQEDAINVEEKVRELDQLKSTLTSEAEEQDRIKKEAQIKYQEGLSIETNTRILYNDIQKQKENLAQIRAEGLRNIYLLESYTKKYKENPTEDYSRMVNALQEKVNELDNEYEKLKADIMSLEVDYQSKKSSLEQVALETRENSQDLNRRKQISVLHNVQLQTDKHNLAAELAKKRSELNGPQLLKLIAQ